jgi:hypothetical protein
MSTLRGYPTRQEHPMTDRTVPGIIDAVPEADFVEQTLPAYPDTADSGAADYTESVLPSGVIDREAAEADVIEQSIPVPLDDEYEDEAY